MNLSLYTSFSRVLVDERKEQERKKYQVQVEEQVHFWGEELQPETLNALFAGGGLFISSKRLWIEISGALALSRRKKAEQDALIETFRQAKDGFFVRCYDQLPREMLFSLPTKSYRGIPEALAPQFKFFTNLQKFLPCHIEVLHLPDQKEIYQYLQARSRRIGVVMEPDAIPHFLKRVGLHPDDIENGLQLLKLLTGEEPKNVKAYIPHLPESLETAIHFATRSLWQKKLDIALQHLERLQLSGADPKRILSYLEGDVRRQITSAGKISPQSAWQKILQVLQQCDLRMVVTDENAFQLLQEAFYRIYGILLSAGESGRIR